jgi:hypothetical protein
VREQKQRSELVRRFDKAILLGVFVIDHLNSWPNPKDADGRRLFGELKSVVADLPPDDHDGYRQSTLAACEQAANSGEAIAARYQMVSLVRRLRTQRGGYEADLDGPATSAVPAPRPPAPIRGGAAASKH